MSEKDSLKESLNEIQEKVIALETRLSYQDDTVEALNDVVSCQHKQIETLEKQVKILSQRVESLTPADIGFADEEPPPPHY